MQDVMLSTEQKETTPLNHSNCQYTMIIRSLSEFHESSVGLLEVGADGASKVLDRQKMEMRLLSQFFLASIMEDRFFVHCQYR